MSLITKYRNLPQARNVPDVVVDVQQMMDRLSELQAEQASIQAKLYRATPKMMDVLRRDWSDSELKEAGFLVG